MGGWQAEALQRVGVVAAKTGGCATDAHEMGVRWGRDQATADACDTKGRRGSAKGKECVSFRVGVGAPAQSADMQVGRWRRAGGGAPRLAGVWADGKGARGGGGSVGWEASSGHHSPRRPNRKRGSDKVSRGRGRCRKKCRWTLRGAAAARRAAALSAGGNAVRRMRRACPGEGMAGRGQGRVAVCREDGEEGGARGAGAASERSAAGSAEESGRACRGQLQVGLAGAAAAAVCRRGGRPPCLPAQPHPPCQPALPT